MDVEDVSDKGVVFVGLAPITESGEVGRADGQRGRPQAVCRRLPLGQGGRRNANQEDAAAGFGPAANVDFKNGRRRIGLFLVSAKGRRLHGGTGVVGGSRHESGQKRGYQQSGKSTAAQRDEPLSQTVVLPSGESAVHTRYRVNRFREQTG